MSRCIRIGATPTRAPPFLEMHSMIRFLLSALLSAAGFRENRRMVLLN